MNRLILAIITLMLALVPGLQAGGSPPAPHVYEGRITGLFCNACATKVKASLSNLKGVTAVKITSTTETGVQKVHIESSSGDLTREMAIQALGEDSRSFTLLNLEKLK